MIIYCSQTDFVFTEETAENEEFIAKHVVNIYN